MVWLSFEADVFVHQILPSHGAVHLLSSFVHSIWKLMEAQVDAQIEKVDRMLRAGAVPEKQFVTVGELQRERERLHIHIQIHALYIIIILYIHIKIVI